MELDWAAELRSQPGMERVMTAGALLSPDSKMPADHLVSAARGNSNGHGTAAIAVRRYSCIWVAFYENATVSSCHQLLHTCWLLLTPVTPTELPLAMRAVHGAAAPRVGGRPDVPVRSTAARAAHAGGPWARRVRAWRPGAWRHVRHGETPPLAAPCLFCHIKCFWRQVQ